MQQSTGTLDYWTAGQLWSMLCRNAGQESWEDMQTLQPDSATPRFLQPSSALRDRGAADAGGSASNVRHGSPPGGTDSSMFHLCCNSSWKN